MRKRVRQREQPCKDRLSSTLPIPLYPIVEIPSPRLDTLPQAFGGNDLSPGGDNEILLGPVIGRDGDAIAPGVFGRESLDDIIGGLALARVNDLKPGRRSLLSSG